MSEPDAGSAVTELTTTATARRRRLACRRHQGLLDAQRRRRRVPRLRALRARAGRHRLGAGRPRHARAYASARRRRYMNGEHWCPLYFDGAYRARRARCCSAPAGSSGRSAGFNVERLGNSARSLAVGRYAFDRRATRAHAPAVRSSAGRVPGTAVDVRRRGAQARVGATAARTGGRDRRRVGLPTGPETAMAKLAATRPASSPPTSRCRRWARPGYCDDSLVEYCFRRTRGWMIAGGSVEILKNRIAEHVFGRRFPARKALRRPAGSTSALFDPRSVALVGASDVRGKADRAGRSSTCAATAGTATVYPVNPGARRRCSARRRGRRCGTCRSCRSMR